MSKDCLNPINSQDYFRVISEILPKDYEGRNLRLTIVLCRIQLRIVEKMSNVKDHKGCLEITWKTKPNETEMHICKTIWSEFHEYEVKHFLLA